AGRDRPPDAPPGAHVPELHCALALLVVEPVHPVRVDVDGEQPAVRAEGDLPDRHVPLVERAADGRPGLRIEEANVAVDRSDGDELPAWVEGDCRDDGTAGDPESLPSRSGVVDDGVAIELARDEPLPVGTEGDVGG